MRVICAYCKKDLGFKEPMESNLISHGMCPGCYSYFQNQLNGLKLGEYLDRFETPVLVVDDNVRVIAANQEMAKLLNKPERDVCGLLGGDVLECQNARLPGGCGRSIHCKTCTIRIMVGKTIESGEAQPAKPAFMDQNNQKVSFWISTEFLKILDRALVKVIIKNLS